MSNVKEKNVNSLYLDLYRFEQSGEYERAIKISNKILHVAPNEAKAFHCKIVCIMQFGRFEEALQILQKNKDLANNLYFEKAYCQYRLNEPEQALRTLNASPTLDTSLIELKAQLLYRLEKYNKSYNLYRELIKNSNDEYNEERQANLGAIAAHLKELKVVEREDATYEETYNYACYLLENAKYVEAERQLKHCEKLCRASLEEDGCNEEEIEQELGVVKVQLGFCYQKQGRIKEAQELYTSVLKLKSEDVALIAVASNNLVVINKDQNVFDSKKKMKYATQETLNHKLNGYQRKQIALNNCIVNYYFNQPDQCRKLCDALVQQWPDMALKATVIKAMLLCREGEVQKAVELLETFGRSMPEMKLYLQLTAVHLLLTRNAKKKACDVLQSLGDVTYQPGVVGALVTLQVALGDEAGASKVFEDTVAWYKKQKLSQGDLGNMWMQAAQFHLRHGHPAVAAGSLEELLKTNSNDLRTKAKLIMAYVQFDKEKSKALCKELPTLQKLTDDINDNNIDITTLVFGTKSQRNKDSSPSTPKSELRIQKKHRKRRGKLPKNYDSEISPDPERWLPKYERTGFKRRRDRRVKDVMKGSQGTSSTSDLFDFSKGSEQSQDDYLELSDKSSNTSSNASNSSYQKKNQQKKKRKGSKW